MKITLFEGGQEMRIITGTRTEQEETMEVIYGELLVARYLYGPVSEELEEDDEAALLLKGIEFNRPGINTNYEEAIRLLTYFLSEYGYHEEPVHQTYIDNLVKRAGSVLPSIKRQRRSMRMWMRYAQHGLSQ